MAKAKKNAAKASKKALKHYAVPVAGMVNARTYAPMVGVVASNDADTIKQLEADPSAIPVTKAQASAIETELENNVYESIRSQIYNEVKSELENLSKGPKYNAGDFVWAVLLIGIGMLGGAILF